ncbi:MAG: DoxX family protein [Acidobacteriota bacterium]
MATLMNSSSTEGGPIRIASAGHAAFATTMIALGIMGLVTGDFVQIWQPVPKWVPGQVAYLCALLSLGCGIGLLWRRSALVASRVLFASLMIWLLVLRLPNLFYQTPLVLVAWTFGSTAVMVAGAWVLYSWFAAERDRPRLGFITGAGGLRVARTLYGLSLIPFGLAHFLYLDATTVLIPGWLPWHVAWAYLTGATFIAAGLAVSAGVLARLAAALSTLQMGLFGLIVWVPRVVAGTVNDFQRGEFIVTCALTAGAWVVADSYRGTPLGRLELGSGAVAMRYEPRR